MGEIKNWREFLKDVPTDVLLSEVDSRKEEKKNSIDADPIAIEIIEDIDYALVRFGKYQFSDKGPHEVMDIYSIKRKLETKPIIEIGKILTQVLDYYGYDDVVSVGDYSHGSRVVNSLIGEFDSLSEEDFTELLNCDDRFEY